MSEVSVTPRDERRDDGTALAVAVPDDLLVDIRRAGIGRAGIGLSEVEVLAHVPGERLVVRGRLDTTTVVVRCLPDEAATQQFRYLEALSSARSSVLRVPAPLALVEMRAGTSALVLEHVDGVPCTRLVSRGGTTAPGLTAMALAGRALADLHSLDPTSVPGLRVADAGDHLAQLVRPFPDRLAAALPAWGEVVERALHHVRSADRSSVADPSHPVGRAVLHRDVHLRQMFRHDDRLAIVDWDLAAVGDPAFDVGYLLTHLDTHVDDSHELQRAVLDGYGDPAMTADRLAPYRSFNLLRRACRRFRLRDAGWEAEMHRMLHALARTLDLAGVPT